MPETRRDCNMYGWRFLAGGGERWRPRAGMGLDAPRPPSGGGGWCRLQARPGLDAPHGPGSDAEAPYDLRCKVEQQRIDARGGVIPP